MKLNLSLPLLLIALLVASGCSSVTTTHPLSSNPKPIDQEEFEGAWLADDQTFHVKFSSNGVAKIAGVEWKSNQFHIVHGEMIVTEGDEHNFLSVRFQEDGEWMEDYFFLPYTFTEQDDLILWAPDTDVFEELIEKKQLQGIIKKGKYSTNITITNAPAGLLEIINDPENLKLFEYREPTILRKITK
jgi:hypothetical protein